MTDPLIGVAYTFTAYLDDALSPGMLCIDPPLAIGDVQVSLDNGALTNITTLPVVTPAGSSAVVVTLSIAEMTVVDQVAVFFHDPDGVWGDQIWTITPTATAPARIGNAMTLSSSERDALFVRLAQTALTESYAALGAAPTFEQFQFMLWSALHDYEISGTVMTSHKLDATTPAMAWTLDDATNPTTRTRSA